MAQEVLLIEADPALGRLMRQVIQETIPDFSTQVAVDSTEALDYLFCTGAFTHREPELPALILLDLDLPYTNGLVLLQLIKSYVRLQTVPVVMLAELADNRAIARGYERGANGCVIKTTDRQQFIANLALAANYWLKVNRAVRTNTDNQSANNAG